MEERNSQHVDEEEEVALAHRCNNAGIEVANWGWGRPAPVVDMASETRRDIVVAASLEMHILAPLPSFFSNNHRKMGLLRLKTMLITVLYVPFVSTYIYI